MRASFAEPTQKLTLAKQKVHTSPFGQLVVTAIYIPVAIFV
jgi:hypothetical protein